MLKLKYCFLLIYVLEIYQCHNGEITNQNYYVKPHNFFYNQRILPNSQLVVLTQDMQKIPQDRKYNFIKHFKKRKKNKFYKNKHPHCGFPLKLKITKKNDDNFDVVKVKLPYGFANEYHPRNIPYSVNNSITKYEKLLQLPAIKFTYLKPFPPTFVAKYKPIAFKTIAPLPMKRWHTPTSWKLAQPGIPVSEYILNEPLPGLFSGSPPRKVTISKNRHIPFETMEVITQDIIQNSDNSTKLNNKVKHSSRYSEKDRLFSSEKIIIVTPLPFTKVFNSSIFNHNQYKNENTEKKRSNHIGKIDDEWKPVLT